MSQAQMQWHPLVHLKWARERLIFWRLGFYPTYRRTEVLQALDIICEKHGVKSRTIYEVFGQYDLIVRLWLPSGVEADDVDRDIKLALTSFHLELCGKFEVSEIIRQWFWPDRAGPGEQSEPDSAAPPVLEPVPSGRNLSHVNAIVDDFNRGLIDQEEAESDKVTKELLSRGVLGIRDSEAGIKFAMIVSTPADTDSRFPAMESLAEQLTAILDNAHPVLERSLYSGIGFGRFLILGKIPEADFYSINTFLIEPISVQASIAGVFRSRTMTYIGSNPKLQRFSETLTLPSRIDGESTLDIDEILDTGENARIEFKASIFSDVDRWIHKGDRNAGERPFRTFARAVVAMLNSNGGLILIGALERSKRNYESEEKLQHEPRLGNNILLGIGFDMADWKRAGRDEYENRVRQKLQSAIEPNPLDLLEFSFHEVEGRHLLAVSIGSEAPGWFYLREDERFSFIVRRGASSKVISGPEEDSYKLMVPRGH